VLAPAVFVRAVEAGSNHMLRNIDGKDIALHIYRCHNKYRLTAGQHFSVVKFAVNGIERVWMTRFLDDSHI